MKRLVITSFLISGLLALLVILYKQEPTTGDVIFPVIKDMAISEKQPYIYLYSPESNKHSFLIKYEIYATDNTLVFSTKWLEGGLKYKYNLYDIIQRTDYYTVKVLARVSDSDTICNSINYDVFIEKE